MRRVGDRRWWLVSMFLSTTLMGAHGAAAQARPGVEFRVLATAKTSTMEKEMNEAADEGFRFDAVMGGETAVGGKEAVAVMSRSGGPKGRFAYRLLATTKTSTLQKELSEAGSAGYEIMGMTVAKTAIGGKEIVAIVRRSREP